MPLDLASLDQQISQLRSKPALAAAEISAPLQRLEQDREILVQHQSLQNEVERCRNLSAAFPASFDHFVDPAKKQTTLATMGRHHRRYGSRESRWLAYFEQLLLHQVKLSMRAEVIAAVEAETVGAATRELADFEKENEAVLKQYGVL